MENKIDAELTVANRDKIIQFINDSRDLMPFLADLTPEVRQSLLKMGEAGRPFVESCLTLVEQDDSFMPRSFDKAKMRQDNDLYEMALPIYIALVSFLDAVEDTLMLVGSDLILAGLDVYRSAKDNGKGENIDPLVPLLARRFKRKPTAKKDDPNEGGEGENPQG